MLLGAYDCILFYIWGNGMTRTQANLVLFCLTIITGSTYLFSKFILETVSALSYLAIRFCLAALIMYVLAPHKIHRIPTAVWIRGMSIGVFLAIGFILMTLGLRDTGAGQTAFIISLEVVFVPVLGWLFYGQRISWGLVGSLLVAIVGLALLTLQNGLSIAAGNAWVLGSVLCFAVYTILNARYAARYAAWPLAWIQLAVTGLLSGLVMLAVEPFQWHLSSEAWWSITYLVLICTVFRFVVQTYAQGFTSAVDTSLIFMLEPVVALVLAACFLGEVFSVQQGIGCLLILLASVLARFSAIKKLYCQLRLR